jgi:pyruvate formate lyase activating enzyme
VGRDEVAWRELMPEQLLATARRCAAEDPRMAGVAFTYNEPLVAWEYVRDAAALAHEAGLGTVLVSAGCVSPTVVDAVAPHLDAANIDLKSIKPDTYRSLGGDVSCVQASIASLVAAGVHVELTCLVVPQVNDTAEEMDELAAWVASVDAGIPLHVSRFFPAHRLRDRAPTAVAKVYELADVARAHLAHVYTGNC